MVRRANFSRREQSSLHRKAKLVKVSANPLCASDFVRPRREHAGDIFDEDKPGPGLHDDTASVRPEVAFVVLSSLSTGETVRLARDAANEAVNRSTPCAAIEGSGIAPNRRWSHMALFHC
nr:hypothetical protein [Agrobacterium rubi]